MPVKTRKQTKPRSPGSPTGSDYRDNSYQDYDDEDEVDGSDGDDPQVTSFGSNKSANLRRRPLHQSHNESNISGFIPDCTSSPHEPSYDWDPNSPSPSKNKLYPNITPVYEQPGSKSYSSSFNESQSSTQSSYSPKQKLNNSPYQKMERKKKSIKKRNDNDWIFIMLVVIPAGLIFYGICSYLFFVPKVSDEPEVVRPNANVRLFGTIYRHFREEFPTQEERSWKTIKAAIKRVLEGDSDYPATIMFVAQKTQRVELECIVSKIANAYMQATFSKENITLSGIDLSKLSAPDSKLKLDNSLSNAFQDSQCRLAIIKNAEVFNSGILEMLHSYCDHLSAPFKDVVFVLTLFVDDSVALNEKEVDNYVSRVWAKSGMNYDKTFALMSRVANSKVMIFKESQSVLETHCGHILRR